MADNIIGVGVNIDTAPVGNLRTQLRQATQEVQAMAAAFGTTSVEAANAARRAAELRDQIGDTRDLISAFSPDEKFNAVAQSLQGVVGGFTAVQGALALFGVESENVQQTLLKVQSALALSQGLNSVLAAKDAFINLGAVIKSTTAFQAIYTVSTRLATAAMAAFGIATEGTSVAFKLLRGAIISTGIGALVVAIGYAVSKIIEWTEATDAATASGERFNAELDKTYEKQRKAIQQGEELEIARAKSVGASEKEIFELRQFWAGKREEQLKQEAANARAFKVVSTKEDEALEEERRKNEITRLEQQGKEVEQQRQKDAAAKTKADADAKRAEEKAAAERKKLLDKEREENKKIDDETHQYKLDQADQAEEREKQRIQDGIERGRAAGEVAVQQSTEVVEAKEKLNQREAEHRQRTLEIISGSLDAFATLAGKQTALGKTLAIASATIATYQAAVLAYKDGLEAGGPYGIALGAISAAAAVAAGIANIQKIVAVQVPGGGGGGAPSISATGAGGGGAPIAPTPQVQTTSLDQNTINKMGNSAVKAYVVESDISNSQERIRRIQNSAKID